MTEKLKLLSIGRLHLLLINYRSSFRCYANRTSFTFSVFRPSACAGFFRSAGLQVIHGVRPGNGGAGGEGRERARTPV